LELEDKGFVFDIKDVKDNGVYIYKMDPIITIPKNTKFLNFEDIYLYGVEVDKTTGMGQILTDMIGNAAIWREAGFSEGHDMGYGVGFEEGYNQGYENG
jgi:hypothetical protein